MAKGSKNNAQALLDEASQVALLAAEAAKIAAAHDANVATLGVELETLGERAAQGSAALTDAAILFSTAVAANMVTESDAPRLYLAFVSGHNSALRLGVDALPADEKTAKVPISIFRTFGKSTTAAVVDASPELYARVIRVHGGMSTKERNSGYNSLAAVNRAINDFCSDTETGQDAKGAPVIDIAKNVATMVSLFSPVDKDGEEAADAWVRDRIAKKGAAAKSELEKIEQLVETLGKLVEKTDYAHLLDAHEACVKALAETHAEVARKADATRTFEVLRAEKPTLELVRDLIAA